MRRLLACAALWAAAAISSGHSVAGERPSVRFHAAELIECRDVTPDAFLLNNPGEKVVEARFRVSVLAAAGDAGDVSELLFTVTSPERRVRVIDFLPRTELTTDRVGSSEVVNSNDRQRRLELGLGGDVSGGLGPLQVQGKPTAATGVSDHDTVRETFRQLPALELLVASGVTSGEHGAFFKLRRSTQSTLEGTHDFCCLFAVPCDWRGDWLQIACRAHADVSQYLTKRTEVCGESVQLAGCYLAGDAEAKFAAQRLSAAQEELSDRDPAGFAPRSWAALSNSPSGGLLSFTAFMTSRERRQEAIVAVDPRVKFAQTRAAMGRFAGSGQR